MPQELKSGKLSIVYEEKNNQLTVSDGSQVLAIIESTGLMAPVLDGKSEVPELLKVEMLSNSDMIMEYKLAGTDNFKVKLSIPEQTDGAVDFSCEFTSSKDSQLNRLGLFGKDSFINCYNLINFRNKHNSTNVYPELLIGDDNCETNTYSEDWQFAPHPTMFIFQKLETNMFFGALDLPKAFGMYFKSKKFKVEEFYLDYGNYPYGKTLKAGEKFESPRFRLFVRNSSVYETLDDFSSMLINGKIIADPKQKERLLWWQEPLYCTWVDQWMASETQLSENLQEQANATGHTPADDLNEAMVRQAVSIIKKEKLPFRTILLDEGWAITRGQWEPDQKKFPDLRKLVDELHADGFKVVVWWNWAEVRDNAEVTAAHLTADGKRNRHNCVTRDYSKKSTQEEYLKPLFHKLFSSDPGCYDLDGVKTDFQADKVHAEMPVEDPEWRGEENYFLQIYKLFYHEMKKHKPDAVHIGCAGNFYLAEYIDINRTYDIFSSNHLEHESRGLMLKHTAPGCPVAYDFHTYLENLEEYFESAKKCGASIQIGNIIYSREASFAKAELADAKYYDILKKYL
jgi:hypothetical protein